MENVTSKHVSHYLSEQLESLQEPVAINTAIITSLEDFIFETLTRAYYRDRSIEPEYLGIIKDVIKKSVENNSPLPLVCPFGGYKLWRLNESPYAEWAELFYLIHKTQWLKPILSIYKPGVHFDFFSDGVIIPTLNGITQDEIETYNLSFRDIAANLKPYLPDNLNFTFHNLEELYGSTEEFFSEYEQNYQIILEQNAQTPKLFTEQERTSAQSNYKSDTPLTDVELHHVLLRHEAAAVSSKRRPYYRTPNKIFVGFTPIAGALPVKSTRTSSMRFWIGKGILKQHANSFIENIRSPHSEGRTTTIAVELLQFPMKSLQQIEVAEQ